MTEDENEYFTELDADDDIYCYMVMVRDKRSIPISEN